MENLETKKRQSDKLIYFGIILFFIGLIIGLIIPSNFNGPPKYIYYNIITINDIIKPLVLKHLNNEKIYLDFRYFVSCILRKA